MSDPHWSKYPKMAESTQAWSSLPSGDWVVTEKIHGANFSVVADSSGGTHFAKRSGMLPAHEDFYSFRSVGLDARLAAAAHRLLDALRGSGGASAAAITSVCVFGELFGGHYPHPQVAPVPGLAPVQRGVWYSPSLQFVGFDVCVGEPGGGAPEPRRFLDFSEARRVARAAGFLFAEPLAQGSLQLCLDAPVRLSSRVPAMLGLPSLPEHGVPNLAEGVVVRLAREAAPRGGGAGARGGARMMFKRKIEEFSEKQYQNDQWRESKAGGGESGAPSGAPSGAELLRYEMAAAVSEPRMAAVASKVGRVDVTDKEACRNLLQLLVDDVVEALVADGLVPSAEAFAADAELAAELNRLARRMVAPFLRAQAAPPAGAAHAAAASGAPRPRRQPSSEQVR